ncbi:MAG: InlB B-repeat-containing protein [Clostridia bacterium]|nr:InlB B-repeat-containing protein [Clostridia bacterium]
MCGYRDNSVIVTFDSDGGTAVGSQAVAKGAKATRPEDPTREGYSFQGWTLNGAEYSFDTPVTADITLKAQWAEIFTVTFESDGGSDVDPQSVISGETATQPENPARGIDEFLGWYLMTGDQMAEEAYIFDTPVTGDVTLKAKWKVLYTVTVLDGMEHGTVTADKETAGEGDTVTLTITPDAGYKPDTLTVKQGETDVTVDEKNQFTMPAGDVTVSATFMNRRTVTFDTDGGSAVEDQNVPNGGKATRPDDPVWEGFDFIGWTLDGADYDFDTAVTEDITLKAVWKHVHDGIEFQLWTDATSLPAEPGSYVLTTDVTLSDENAPWRLYSGVYNLCLHGHTIEHSTYVVVYVSNDATLNLYDDTDNQGKITGGAAGVSVTGGVFNMYGGTLTGNRRGVWLRDSNARFTMTGGVITGNSEYGVHADTNVSFSVSGTPMITGNGAGGNSTLLLSSALPFSSRPSSTPCFSIIMR